jgi:hypothetical protein
MTKIRKMGCLLLWLLLSAMMAAGQTDAGTGQAPDDSQRNTPAPAFGQEAPAVVVNENPPISALDQPSLEPNIQPRSMLLGGVEGAESLDSNIGSDARPAWHSVSRALAGLTLQRLWSRYQVEGAYVGGASYYNAAGNGWRQVHDLQAQTAVLWRTGQLTIRDSFSYLPEGEFGGGSFGGAGGFQLGLGGLGAGMGVLGSGFGGQFGGQFGILGSGTIGSLGQSPRFNNVTMLEAVQGLTPRSSVTAAASYGLVHFTDSTQGFINSQQAAAQGGYNYSISRKDQIAVTYGFQSFHFPAAVGADNVTSHVVQGMYGHRVSGRMDFEIGAGPQWTRIQDPFTGTNNRLSVAGRAILRYRFKQTATSLSFVRFDSSGSGFFAGAQSNVASFQISRVLGRKYNAVGNVGFAHNQRLQSAALGVAATSYNYAFAGFTVRRQFGYNWGAFLGYQWNDQIFDTCPVVGTFCNRISVRHVATIGVDWHFRPIRID